MKQEEQEFNKIWLQWKINKLWQENAHKIGVE
jgi:hypothetical protein